MTKRFVFTIVALALCAGRAGAEPEYPSGPVTPDCMIAIAAASAANLLATPPTRGVATDAAGLSLFWALRRDQAQRLALSIRDRWMPRTQDLELRAGLDSIRSRLLFEPRFPPGHVAEWTNHVAEQTAYYAEVLTRVVDMRESVCARLPAPVVAADPGSSLLFMAP